MSLEKLVQRVIQISVILGGITLLLYAIVGTQIRMIADDYCSAHAGLTQGAIEGTILRYNSWTGRYIDIFIKFSLAPLQPAIHAYVPTIALVLWLLAVGYLIFQILGYLKVYRSPLLVFGSTIFITFTMYRILPSYQHSFWLAAMVSYVGSTIVTMFWLGTVVQFFTRERSLSALILFIIWSGIVIMLIGGLAETVITSLSVGFVLLFLGIPFVFASRRRHFASFVISGGLFSGLSLLPVLLSPGAWQRRELGVAMDGLNPSVWDALPNGTLYSLAFTFGEPFGITFGQTFSIAFLGSLFLMGFLFGIFYLDKHPDYELPAPRNLLLAFGISFVASVLLIFAVIYPSYYAARGVLPLRPLILPRLVQLLTTVYWTYLAVAAAQKHQLLPKLRQAKTWSLMLIVLSFLFIWMPLVSIYKLVNLFPDYQAYAQSWDERHELLLKTEPDETVVVPPLRFDIEDVYDLGKLGEDADFWINGCAAAYYGVEGISVESDPLD